MIGKLLIAMVLSMVLSLNCYAETEEVSLREKDLKSLVNNGDTLVKERKAVELRKAIGQPEHNNINELMRKISDSVDALYEYKIPDKPKNLPIGDYKRIRYGILVKPNLSKDEYKYIFYKFLFYITSMDNDIDEITVLAYDNEDALDYFYNVASIEWCPQADLETKMKKIAYSNDRGKYKIIIKWADKY